MGESWGAKALGGLWDPWLVWGEAYPGGGTAYPVAPGIPAHRA